MNMKPIVMQLGGVRMEFSQEKLRRLPNDTLQSVTTLGHYGKRIWQMNAAKRRDLNAVLAMLDAECKRRGLPA